MKIEPKYIPAFRFAFGATFIMALAMASGGELAYIVPLLALSMLGPGTEGLSFRQGVGFAGTVALASLAGYFFTGYLYEFTWVYVPLLGLLLFWLYYTTALGLVAKLFLLISLLAMPVSAPGIDVQVWAYAVAKTLMTGAALAVLVVWVVYGLFPDAGMYKTKQDKPPVEKTGRDASRRRLTDAAETLAITFPVILAFIFFRWSSALIVLIYIVILTMIPVPGKAAGKIKIYGNVLGGMFLLIFYSLILVVPGYFFFLVLYLGTALFFAAKIFSDQSDAVLYKTGFSTLTLIIGEASIGTETAGAAIWMRIIQIMAAVFYVVGVGELVERYKRKKTLNPPLVSGV